MNNFIIPAIDPANRTPHIKEYDHLVGKVNKGKSRIANSIESRMIPSKENKENPISFIDK